MISLSDSTENQPYRTTQTTINHSGITLRFSKTLGEHLLTITEDTTPAPTTIALPFWALMEIRLYCATNMGPPLMKEYS